MDDHGHGTHVAGTIAAAIDNHTGSPAEAEGVVGVAPNARILAYKVCRSDGTCDDFAIQQAIAERSTDGARVINMSLGQTGVFPVAQRSGAGRLERRPGHRRRRRQRWHDDRFYPAAFDNVISVAAFDEDHRAAVVLQLRKLGRHLRSRQRIMSTYPWRRAPASTTQATRAATRGIAGRRWRPRTSPAPRRWSGHEAT